MLTAIRQWVLRTMMNMKGQTGVVQTLPKRDLIELNTQITAQKLMQGGIDPNSLKNADQVENAIIAIESRPKVQEGIRSAKVIDMEGKEIKDPKNIIGGKEINQQTLNEELMKTENPYSDLVKTPRPKTIKEREKEILESMEKNNKETVARIKQRKMIEDAIDNMSPSLTGDTKYDATLVAEDLAEQMGKVYDDLPQMERLDLYDKAYTGLSAQRYKGFKKPKDSDADSQESSYDDGPADFDPDADNETFAQGGRAGFKTGLGKRFLDLIKGKPKLKFDERRFREGPIDLDFLKNIEQKDIEKFIRTRDTGGPGGYGMYKNFADMPAGLRAAELIKTIKTTDGGINYKAAELFLGKKLKGNESADELIQMLNRQEMRAEGGRIGLKEGLTPLFEDYLKQRDMIEKRQRLEQLMKDFQEDMRRRKVMEQKQMVANGGRIGFKEGMSRRTFLKLLGGLAAVPIIGKFIKPLKVGKKVSKVPIIKTDDVPGKPEWFDALVNKVIIEGDNVTKKFATAERQSIHQKTLKDGSVVRVTEDLDEGAVRVEYDSYDNTFEDTVQLQYKKPLPDEGDPRPTAEFTTAESGPVGRSQGPDDYDIEIDEVGGSSIRDLDSDVSILKQYATGKGPTMKEIVEIKKRKDKAKAITTDPEAQSDAVISRQGEMLDYDDYASGGIARMLGE